MTETPKPKRKRRTKAEMEAARAKVQPASDMTLVTLKGGRVLEFGCVGKTSGVGFEFFYSMDGGRMRTIKVALSEIAAVESDGMEQPVHVPVLQPMGLPPGVVMKPDTAGGSFPGPRVHAPLKGIHAVDMTPPPVQVDSAIRGEALPSVAGVVPQAMIRLADGTETRVMGSMS